MSCRPGLGKSWAANLGTWAKLAEISRYFGTWADDEQKSWAADIGTWDVAKYLGTWAGEEQKSWAAGLVLGLSWLKYLGT